MELAEVSPHARDSPGSAPDGVTGSTEPYGYEPSSVVGRWAALAFVGFLITLDVGEFLSNVGGLDLDLLNLLVAVPIPLTFVVVVASLHEITPPGQRLWTLLGLLFGTMWATVSVTAYFLELTVVRYAAEQHREADVSLLSFGELNRTSVGWSLNVLGWGVFLALALLVVAPALKGGGRCRLGRWSLRLSGISMLLLAVGFVAGSEALQLGAAAFGWFVGLPVAGIMLASILKSGRIART